jgi:hypothetical protein
MSTVLRVVRDEGLLLEACYQRERRRLAAERKGRCSASRRPARSRWSIYRCAFRGFGIKPGADQIEIASGNTLARTLVIPNSAHPAAKRK